MAEEGTALGTVGGAGQAAPTPDKGTSQAEPVSAAKGKPADSVLEGKTTSTPEPTGKTEGGTKEGTEQSFFDPRSLDPQLMPAYKEMQKAFSKKTQEISKDRQKIEAYDAFSKDPMGQLQSMASRMGMKLEPAAQNQGGQQVPGLDIPPDWSPNSWGEVFSKFLPSLAAEAERRAIEKLRPIIGEVQEIKKNNIEKLLDDSCPDWRQYEDEMKQMVMDHPTLVKDPVKLYKMALPPEVLESRATQQALKKLEAKVKSSNTGGTSTTSKHQAEGIPDKKMSFQESVEFAKAKLAKEGLRPPGA